MGAAFVKGVAFNADGSIQSCLFCDICADKPGYRQTEVAYENDKVVVFSPLGRCAAQHWLVRPPVGGLVLVVGRSIEWVTGW